MAGRAAHLEAVRRTGRKTPRSHGSLGALWPAVPQKGFSMECPRDGTDLQASDVQGASVLSCSECSGLWLPDVSPWVSWPRNADPQHSVSFDPDLSQTVLSPYETSLLCPVCGKLLKQFITQARGQVKSPYCPDAHGRWLDKEEARHVAALLKKAGHAPRRNPQRPPGA
jgi:Zn-finger nucleic acid-binding protein